MPEKDFVNVPLSLVNNQGIDTEQVYLDLSEDQANNVER